jgi:hypothetical protein
MDSCVGHPSELFDHFKVGNDFSVGKVMSALHPLQLCRVVENIYKLVDYFKVGGGGGLMAVS